MGTGVAVWAVVVDWQNAGGDLKKVAHDYQVSVEAVEAALAFYRDNKAVIDARIAANDAD